jgi:polysaccharide deacetylase family protein (PEP-CTERM system associated)
VRATFFALGKVCEKYPQLLPAIVEAGHEVASHGYGHEEVFRLTPEQFADDLQRSIEIITEQTGRRPIGYRAPRFSITEQTLWAGPILAEQGIRYSSSIFPIRGRRYGIPDWPRYPGRWPDCPLIEFPITTLRVLGANLPTCGGGYTRLLPAVVHALAIRAMNAAERPAVVYLHPYELALDEVEWFRRAGFAVSWKRRYTQELWRRRVAPRLSALLREFPFVPMRRVLDIHADACQRGAAPTEPALPLAALAGA